MLAKEIGANIQSARKLRGWSLQKLAAKIEPSTSYQQLGRLETGDRPLTLDWIERIAKALEVEPIELLAPGSATPRGPQAIHLDEQVAVEAARSLAAAALGDEPDWGRVQAVSEVLRELLLTFSEYPEARADVRVARPAIAAVGRRFAREER